MKFFKKVLEMLHPDNQLPTEDVPLVEPIDDLDMEVENSLSISFVKEVCSVFDNKIGGMPYLPKHFEYPMDKRTGRETEPLAFLAQINFEMMPPLHGFPDHGILQFYIGTDLLFGLDLKHPTLQEGFRVIYHSEILPISELQLTKPVELDFEGDPPFKKELKMKFTPAISVIGWQDFRYERSLLDAYRKQYPLTESVEDIPVEVRDQMEALCNASGSRIGGFPLFTQTDPRQNDTPSDKYTTLLLQLDSDNASGIAWGDEGVCQFFIRPKDLVECDFSHVWYNWDCY